MTDEARAFVKELLQAGQRYDEVRRALVSQGHGTSGFEEEYHAIQKELGITEPPPTPIKNPVVNDLGIMTEFPDGYREPQRTHYIKNVFVILTSLLILGAGIVLVLGYGSVIRDWLYAQTGLETATFDSVERRVQLESMQESASIYRARLTDYSGLCTSIGIDRSVYQCISTPDAYVIETRLPEGAYYCADHTGFVGLTEKSRLTAAPLSCQ